MLTLVVRNPDECLSLRMAIAHLQAAVAHINNEAQGRLKPAQGPTGDVEQLRLIVCGLCDMVAALKARESRHGLCQPQGSLTQAIHADNSETPRLSM